MDYIYYRMYVWYKRKNDCAIVNSILFITSVKFFLCFPIMGIVIAFFESDKNNMTLMQCCPKRFSIKTKKGSKAKVE